eukprot:TRINITY_DN4072_c2_g1_i1.p1 TRINITY_DN4072_c2_g1~~TRINITY_DN4072_c2_g1_i1.p1  ORF type:complete len:358 (+),score=55.38 TRINITY_DN4072_c2_g1_i1:49-1074(+)
MLTGQKALLSALRTLTHGTPMPAMQRCVSNPKLPMKAPLFAELREQLLHNYLLRTPSCTRAIGLLKSKGAHIHNDHVALRSFNDGQGGSGLAFLKDVFLSFGYAAEETITIPALPVNAQWLEPPETTDWPKVFISEMRTDELPKEVSDLVCHHVRGYYKSGVAHAAIAHGDVNALVNILEMPPWNVTAAEERSVREVGLARPELAGAMEYTAWTLTHAHRWNHMTILLNGSNLPGVSTLQELNALLLDEGFVFNGAGGIDGFTQGTPAVQLEQSSTKADTIEHVFACGTVRQVPCSFLELIHRHEGFRGFLGQNAKGIFSSTSTAQLARPLRTETPAVARL